VGFRYGREHEWTVHGDSLAPLKLPAGRERGGEGRAEGRER